ncbi:ParB N-terminal domain-containing protein, partial [Bacillus mycoides]|uniref:ParB N-terminal domain-containing protein n=1 Tax=Bacillus mycoides TaxID=1405 RepID=UPI001C9318B2
TFSRLFPFAHKETQFPLQHQSHQEIHKKIYHQIQQIPIPNIVPNPYQPPTLFDHAPIHQLPLTIPTHRLIHPILITQYQQDNYQIIPRQSR